MLSIDLDEGLAGKKILLTGAGGYLASGIRRRLSQIPCHIRCLARRQLNVCREKSSASIESVVGDVRDADGWRDWLADIDVVIHLASQTSWRVAESDSCLDSQSNLTPMLYLLEGCRNSNKAVTVLFAGSVTQAGMPSHLPIDEGTRDNPQTVYDLHKLMAEQYVKYYTAQYNIRGTILRLANVYGPGPPSSASDRGVLNRMIQRAIDGKSLAVYGSGRYRRDYVFIDDVVSAFLFAAISEDSVLGKHFLIGTGDSCTIKDAVHLVVDRVEKQTGIRVPVEHLPESTAPIERRDYVGDVSAFCGATGWSPRVSLVEGIDRTIRAFNQTQRGRGAF